MKKIISVLTATRAEYGLLKPLIMSLKEDETLDVRLVVTGAHLSPEFGSTFKEIEKDGLKIDEKIEILLSSDTPSSISKSMGLALIGFGDYFEKLKPDILIVLGDRYETLAVAGAAMNARIPIVHLHGGETTEGAIDEAIRHAITKLSYLHFTSNYIYRNRVIQLGENPKRVFNVGALGIENILSEKLMTKKELEKSINYKLDKPFGLVTFHPVTLEKDQSEMQVKELLESLIGFKDMDFIITKANADTMGRIINKTIDSYVEKYDNLLGFTSLGLKRYLSAMNLSHFVIGNSSSGIIEAPSFNIPTINIGDRQKGRIQAKTIINCKPKKKDIDLAIKDALKMKEDLKNTKAINPNGDGNTSLKIKNIIKDFLENDKINLKKQFYDLEEIK